MTNQRPGRWQRVLLAALDDAEAIGVAAVIRDHLGRRPDRSEITAARRAALGLVGAGQADVHHASAQRQGKKLLLLTRPGSQLDGAELERAAAGRPAAEGKRDREGSEQHVEDAVLQAHRAAVHSRRVDVDHLTPDEAAGLADQLRPALDQLAVLQRRLRRRGRSHQS